MRRQRKRAEDKEEMRRGDKKGQDTTRQDSTRQDRRSNGDDQQ